MTDAVQPYSGIASPSGTGIPCPICGVPTKNCPAMFAHAKHRHSNGPCPICGKGVNSVVMHAAYMRGDPKHLLLNGMLIVTPSRYRKRKEHRMRARNAVLEYCARFTKKSKEALL